MLRVASQNPAHADTGAVAEGLPYVCGQLFSAISGRKASASPRLRVTVEHRHQDQQNVFGRHLMSTADRGRLVWVTSKAALRGTGPSAPPSPAGAVLSFIGFFVQQVGAACLRAKRTLKRTGPGPASVGVSWVQAAFIVAASFEFCLRNVAMRGKISIWTALPMKTS